METRYRMKIWLSPTWGMLFAMLTGPVTVLQARAGEVESVITWRNRVITEGIAYDQKDGFLLLEAEAGLHGFTAGLEYLQSLRENYNEVHLSLGYGWDMGPVAAGLAVTRVDYSPGTDDDTWEVAGDLEWLATGLFVFFVDAMYDVDDVRGGFLETGLRLTPPAFGPGQWLTFEPYALVGWDFGYVSGPRRITENHWQVGIELSTSITERLVLFADAHHSRPLSNLRREDEGNHTWGGFGLRHSF